VKARARAAGETWSIRLSADTGYTRKRTRTLMTGTSRKVGNVGDSRLTYEWAVAAGRGVAAGHVHRGPWAFEDEARDWIAVAEAAGCTPGWFKVVKRLVMDWEDVE